MKNKCMSCGNNSLMTTKIDERPLIVCTVCGSSPVLNKELASICLNLNNVLQGVVDKSTYAVKRADEIGTKLNNLDAQGYDKRINELKEALVELSKMFHELDNKVYHVLGTQIAHQKDSLPPLLPNVFGPGSSPRPRHGTTIPQPVQEADDQFMDCPLEEYPRPEKGMTVYRLQDGDKIFGDIYDVFSTSNGKVLDIVFQDGTTQLITEDKVKGIFVRLPKKV